MQNFLPGWETVELIGSGGFSKVYKIKKKDSAEGGEYFAALKVVEICHSEDERDAYISEGYDAQTISGFLQTKKDKLVAEFNLMAQMKGNSNIVSYEDHQVLPREDGEGWRILIRMELLSPISKVGELSAGQVVKLGIDMCRALEICKKKNIIHRDIKPQNIFVNDLGDYKLGDFGVAKVMDHATYATRIGTCGYMAPEVYLGKSYDESIDLYSLGLVLFWLLNDKRMPFLPLAPEPVNAVHIEKAMSLRLSGVELPEPTKGFPELNKIIAKACAYEPKDRYRTAREMRHELEYVHSRFFDEDNNFLTGPVLTPPVIPVPRAESAFDTAPVTAPPVRPAVNVPSGASGATTVPPVYTARPAVNVPPQASANTAPRPPVSPVNNVRPAVNVPPQASANTTPRPPVPPVMPAGAAPAQTTAAIQTNKRSKKPLFIILGAVGGALSIIFLILILILSKGCASRGDTDIPEDGPVLSSGEQSQESNDESSGNDTDDESTVSEWQTTPLEDKAGYEIETKTQYSFRTVSENTNISEWSEWSGWSFEAQTASSDKQVETKNVYCYNAYRVSCGCGCGFVGVDLSDSFFRIHMNIDDYEELQELMLLDMLNAEEKVFIVCKEYNIPTTYETKTLTFDSALPNVKNSVDISGEKWYIEDATHFELKTQYRFRTRNDKGAVVYGAWSEYSDEKVTATPSTEVRTRKLYRYKVKNDE